jgi:hypothetical protein
LDFDVHFDLPALHLNFEQIPASPQFLPTIKGIGIHPDTLSSASSIKRLVCQYLLLPAFHPTIFLKATTALPKCQPARKSIQAYGEYSPHPSCPYPRQHVKVRSIDLLGSTRQFQLWELVPM